MFIVRAPGENLPDATVTTEGLVRTVFDSRILRVWFLVVSPTAGSALVVWQLIGERVTSPTAKDHLIRFDGADDLGAWPLVIGLILLVSTGIWCVAGSRTPGRRRPTAPLVLSILAGSLFAAGARIVTARVNGANIGGAMALFVGPWLIVVLVGMATWLAVRRRTPNLSGLPPPPNPPQPPGPAG